MKYRELNMVAKKSKHRGGRVPKGLGPTFSCRLLDHQHKIISKIAEQTGAPYAEIVRRLVAESPEFKQREKE